MTSDHVNYLVYRYLLESGFAHSTFAFQAESALAASDLGDVSEVRPGSLVAVLRKGLQYLEVETHIDASGPCLAPFSLIHAHRCSYSTSHSPQSQTQNTQSNSKRPKDKDKDREKKRRREKDSARASKDHRDHDEDMDVDVELTTPNPNVNDSTPHSLLTPLNHTSNVHSSSNHLKKDTSTSSQTWALMDRPVSLKGHTAEVCFSWFSFVSCILCRLILWLFITCLHPPLIVTYRTRSLLLP